MSDLIPRRPTFFKSEWPAMPTTRTPKSSGAMITLMSRRNIVPRSCKLTATEGQSWPNSAPARRPTKIHVVSERCEVAYAAMKKMASQRRNVGTSTGSGSTCAPASNDAATAIVAAMIAATRNLFFIGARRKISSVPKGILVSGACQWKRAKIAAHEFPTARWALIVSQSDDLQSFAAQRRPSSRVAKPAIHKQARLLDTQSDKRIDACGAARGKIASQQRDAHQKQRDAHIGERIGSADAIQQAGGLASNRQRDQYAHGRANQRQEHALPEHQPQHLARLRAQRHAQPDFAGALCDGIGQHAVNSNRRENQCERAEQSKQSRTHARRPQPLPQNLLHRLAVSERQILVNLLYLRLQ